MKVIIFGATGMVGQGVLRESLRDPQVSEVLCIGRQRNGMRHVKLRDIVLPDPGDLSPIEDELIGFEACFFCLGVSAVGMREAAYRRVTFDLTLAAARTLARVNPLQMTFVYVSRAGTGSGRRMWARVKGETESALMRLPFRAAVMLRPGIIVPMHGIASKTRLYRIIYKLLGPLLPLLRQLFPQSVTTTEQVGRAMLKIASGRATTGVMESRDINAM